MQQYYTSIEVNNDGYIGTVYNSNSNISEYRTKPYPSQLQAMMDITDFLKTKTAPAPSNLEKNTNVITNTAQLHSTPQPARRCCGR